MYRSNYSRSRDPYDIVSSSGYDETSSRARGASIGSRREDDGYNAPELPPMSPELVTSPSAVSVHVDLFAAPPAASGVRAQQNGVRQSAHSSAMTASDKLAAGFDWWGMRKSADEPATVEPAGGTIAVTDASSTDHSLPDADDDWNAEFQQALDLPETTSEQKFVKNQRLSQLSDDFMFMAELYGRLIISERFLAESQKTIKPITKDLGGLAGRSNFG